MAELTKEEAPPEPEPVVSTVEDSRYKELQSELDKVRTERNQLRRDLAAIQQSESEKASKILELENDNASKTQELEARALALEEKESEIELMTEKVVQKNAEADDLREKLQAETDSIKEADRIIQQDAAYKKCDFCERDFEQVEYVVFKCRHRMHFSCFLGRAFGGSQACPKCKDLIPFVSHPDKISKATRVMHEHFYFLRMSDAVKANEILNRLTEERYSLESGSSAANSYINSLLEVLQKVYTSRNISKFNRTIARRFHSVYTVNRTCLFRFDDSSKVVDPNNYREKASEELAAEGRKILRRQFQEIAKQQGIEVVQEKELPHSTDTLTGKFFNMLYQTVLQPSPADQRETRSSKTNIPKAKRVVDLLEQEDPVPVLYNSGVTADVLVFNGITMSYWFERKYTLTDLCVLGATREHLRNMHMTIENVFRYKHTQISFELLGDIYDIGFVELVQDFAGGRLENFLGYSWTPHDLKMMGLLIDTMVTTMRAHLIHFILLCHLVTFEQLKNDFGLEFHHFAKFKLTPQILELDCGLPPLEIYNLFPDQKAQIDKFLGKEPEKPIIAKEEKRLVINLSSIEDSTEDAPVDPNADISLM